MKNHMELLRKVSPEFFGGNQIYLYDNWQSGPRCIAILYHTLGYYMSSGSNPVNMPDIKYFPNFRYTVLDYVNPGYNHTHEDVYVSQFVLPKMYKNVLTQTQPLTRKVRIKPKQGVSFREAHELRQKFINESNVDMAALPCEEYTNKCYEALVKLLSKVELIDNGYGLNPKKGSVILAEELNNLLFSQGIILRHHKANKYAESYEQKQRALVDIIRHKKAMFGELQKQFTRVL